MTHSGYTLTAVVATRLSIHVGQRHKTKLLHGESLALRQGESIHNLPRAASVES